MEMRLIGDVRDTTGFGLAGIEGAACVTRADVLAALSRWERDPRVAVLLVSEAAAALAPDALARVRSTGDAPILVVLPGTRGDRAAERTTG
jgi:vacuolar-type H+-ATPase subunit F/Vma7